MTDIDKTRYPLAWPDGWRRTQHRTRAKFGTGKGGWSGDGSYVGKQKLSVSQGTSRVLNELGRMGIRRHEAIVISTNVVLRLDGNPRSDKRQPTDPGAAIYWVKDKTMRCMAIDRYDRVEDNLAAIAATLEAMRAIDRHGGASILDRAFVGFAALAAPEQPWQTLELPNSHPTREEIKSAHSRLAMKHHPDRGGDTLQMARINTARDLLLDSLG